MSLLQIADTIESQVLDTLRQTEDFVVEAVKTVATTVEPLAFDVPVPAPVPSATELVDHAFGLAERIVKLQHDYALRIIDAASPVLGSWAKPAPRPAPKPAPAKPTVAKAAESA